SLTEHWTVLACARPGLDPELRDLLLRTVRPCPAFPTGCPPALAGSTSRILRDCRFPAAGSDLCARLLYRTSHPRICCRRSARETLEAWPSAFTLGRPFPDRAFAVRLFSHSSAEARIRCSLLRTARGPPRSRRACRRDRRKASSPARLWLCRRRFLFDLSLAHTRTFRHREGRCNTGIFSPRDRSDRHRGRNADRPHRL